MKPALFSVFDIPGMVLNDFAAQHIAVDVRVYLRGCNGFMPQHALYGPQIGSAQARAWQKSGGRCAD